MGSAKGLYIHVPYCFKKCNYCNFVSYPVSKAKLDFDSYIEILKNEIRSYKGNKINTIYIGGGTPSLLKIEHITNIVKSIEENLIIENLDEFTIEINPYNFNIDYIESLKNIGIDRFSFGFQSFDNEKLRILGRLHRKNDLMEIKKHRRKINNFSIDLIFGLKNDYKLIEKEIKQLMEFEPDHLSIYNLKVEKNTRIFEMLENNRVELDNDQNQSKTYNFINNYLAKNDYNHYEISNYAKKNKRAKHNLKYWNFNEYIGVGLSASGYLNNILYTNYDSFNNYQTDNFRKIERKIDKNQERYYKIMMGLRLKQGVQLKENEYNKLKNIFKRKKLKGYFNFSKNRLSIKEKYFFISNSLIGRVVNNLF